MKIVFFLMVAVCSTSWAKWSVSSYNIRNFDRDYRAGSTNVLLLGSAIQELESDVMGFVEVVNTPAFKTLIQTNLPEFGVQTSKCGGNGKQKLGLAFNTKTFKFVSQTEDLTFTGESSGCGSLRPLFLVTLEQLSTKTKFVFAVAHLKAGGDQNSMVRRWQQYELLESLVKKYGQQHLILMGDFNTTGYSIKDSDYTRFEDLLTQTAYRTVSENLACTSYWEGPLGRGPHQPSVLDHILLTEQQHGQVQDITLGSHCAKVECRPSAPEELGESYLSVSDHCPIKVTFK